MHKSERSGWLKDLLRQPGWALLVEVCQERAAEALVEAAAVRADLPAEEFKLKTLQARARKDAWEALPLLLTQKVRDLDAIK
jgi:hypothetical protein